MSDNPIAFGSEFRASTTEYSYLNSTRTVALSDGGYVVLWGASIPGYVPGYFMQMYVSDVLAQRFDANGTPVGSEFIVNQDHRYACDMGGAIATSDGGFLAVYYSYAPSVSISGAEIVISKFDESGNRVGNEARINLSTAYSQERPHIDALDGGGFVVTWQTREGDSYEPYDIHAQVYDALGAPVGSEIVVNQTLGNYQEYPKVTALEGGGFAIAWGTYGYDADGTGNGAAAMARVFASDGTPVTDEFVMNTTVAGNQQDPALTALAGGGFVAVWESPNAEPSPGWGYGIVARIYDAAGNPVSAEILVNAQVANEQRDPAVAAAPDGGFVVVWSTYVDNGVHAQRFGADGSRIGDEVRVDTHDDNYYDYLNYQASVEFLEDGSYVVSWARASGGSNGAYAIFGQRFAAQTFGTGGTDTLTGTPDNDWLGGAGGDDSVSGLNGTDTMSGGAGSDTLAGGAGNDIYIDSVAADPDGPDAIVEASDGGTRDTILTDRAALSLAGFANVEDATLTGANNGSLTGNGLRNILTGDATDNTLDGGAHNDSLFGGQGNDSLLGGSGLDALKGEEGDDVLTGGGGADTMEGGNGDDTYVDPTGDTIIEDADPAAGIDTVMSSQDFSLGQHPGVEDLVLTGTGAIDGVGNDGRNLITGNDSANEIDGGASNDTIVGGGGADKLTGGTGNDRMEGGAGDDAYNVDSGRDKVIEATDGGVDTVFSSVNLTLSANVENLTLVGTAGIGKGNQGANLITGNQRHNRLEGNGGNDTLAGGAGNDTLNGGANADVFRFGASNAGNDVIQDFNRTGDRFQLSGGSFSGAAVDGADTVLTHNGGTIRVVGVNTLTLTQWNALVLPGGEAISGSLGGTDASQESVIGYDLEAASVRLLFATMPAADWLIP